MNTNARKANIVQKDNLLYLRVENEWYCYDLLSTPLGEGAMGTVYLGYSCSSNEQVAVKRVIDKYANVPSIRARARLEASLLFRHPNLVEMIGYCEFNPNNGPIFIISRLIHGMTLDKHVRENLKKAPNAVKKICETIFPICDALDYIHSKDIVHMDIKPSNIMIENGRSNVRLMDLGIAYTNDTISMTSPGLIGTQNYAAPEQYIESGQNSLSVNKTTDIYELGITLYELLTGYNPFDSPSREETLNKQRTIILPYVQGIPNAIIDVLRKATDKSQINRFQSASEFKAALNNALLFPKPKPKKWLIIVGISCAAVVIVIILIILLTTYSV